MDGLDVEAGSAVGALTAGIGDVVPERHDDVAADDAERIYPGYKALFHSHVEQIWGWEEAWQRQNFAEEWEGARTWWIESQGQLSGYLQLRNGADFMYVLSLGILPDCQGRGIGRRIMRSLQEDAASLAQPLRLSVFRTNPRALSFYQALGFHVTEESEAFHRLEWLPEVVGGTCAGG